MLFFSFMILKLNKVNQSVNGDATVKIHEPNLCVAQQVCKFCLDQDENTNWCEKCGLRKHVFDVDPAFTEKENCTDGLYSP